MIDFSIHFLLGYKIVGTSSERPPYQEAGIRRMATGFGCGGDAAAHPSDAEGNFKEVD